MATRARAIASWALPLAAIAAMLAWSAPPWPDDWDGLGFVESIDHFDMDRFAPHPPGYPVYVVLLKIAGALIGNHVTAATAVAIVSAVATLALLRDAMERAKLAHGVWTFAAIGAPLVWRASSAIGSEAPALACAALAVCGLARRSPALLGVAIGAGLGVRLSWAPFFVAMLFLVSEHRARAWIVAAITTMAWLVPFVAIVGAPHLTILLRTHFAGHAARWGGTAVTEPGFRRVALLARDLFVDGLGVGGDALGIAIALAAASLAFLGIAEWRRAKWLGARAIAIVIAPYAIWILVGQNLQKQPRHALPIVVAIACALVIAAAQNSSMRVRALGVALLCFVSARTFVDARDRRITPPPGAQLVAFVRDAGDAVVFGGASVRYFDSTPLASRAGGAESLGDVALALARRDALPRRVFATDEVRDANRGIVVATLCRPARIDRRAPCLVVYDVTTIAR